MKKTIVRGMKSSVIQAPSTNFATSTTTTVMPVTNAPSPLTSALFSQCGPAIFPPVHDHAGLRKREGQKGADGVERDQPVGDAAKKNEQAAAEHRQHHDAVGVDQPPSAVSEGVRQVIILRDGAAEARKIGEGGVGGKRKNEQNGGDGQVVENAFAEDRGDEHGENALVAGLARIGGGDAVDFHQVGNSRQQHRQQKNNRR